MMNASLNNLYVLEMISVPILQICVLVLVFVIGFKCIKALNIYISKNEPLADDGLIDVSPSPFTENVEKQDETNSPSTEEEKQE